MKCPECRKNLKRVEENLYVCPSCGLEGKMDHPDVCPECGFTLDDGLKNCPICGAELPELVFKVIEKEEEIPEDYGQDPYEDAYGDYGQNPAAEVEYTHPDDSSDYTEPAATVVNTVETILENADRYSDRDEDKNLDRDSSKKTNDDEYEYKYGGRRSGEGSTRRKSNNKKVVMTVAVLALIAVAVLILKNTLLKQKEVTRINLNSYLEVAFAGEDGSGTIDSTFNLQGLIDENPEEFAITDEVRSSVARMMHENNANALSDNDVYLYLFGELFDNGPVSVVFDPSAGLKNGDAVTAIWNCPEETIEDLFPVDIVFENRTYQVKGLEKSTETAEKQEVSVKKEPTKEPTKAPTKTPTKTPTKKPTKVPTQAPADTITIINGIKADKDDFIFPNSSSEYLSYSDLSYLVNADKKEKELYTQTMINEIYARYGYTFTSNSDTANMIRNRVADKDWYIQAQSSCPVAPGDQETLRLNYMNSVERANIEMINNWQRDYIPQ